MPPLIEYCMDNVDRRVRNRLRELDGTAERQCLQRCGTCCRSPFLVVDGDLVTKDDHEALLRTVGRTLEDDG